MTNNSDILRNILDKTAEGDIKGNLKKMAGILNTEQGEALKNAVKNTSAKDIEELQQLINSGDMESLKEKALQMSKNIDPQVLNNLSKLLG